MMKEGKSNDDARCYLGAVEEAPKFTGEDMTYSSTWWAQDLGDNAEIFSWSPRQLLIMACRSLAGTAELWLRIEKIYKSYDDLKAIKEFPEAMNVKQMHELMSNRKKNPNETRYQYMLIMKELGKKS